MILESKTDTILLEEGEDVQESTNMEIDAESHIFLMRMLSKFYSDGIGSSIRETASNALDSHRACGSTEPIIVSFKQNNDKNYEFSVQDFGCGLDDQDVENIIKKYGKSTKRKSKDQLGCFGLGFKSPLAYTSSFYFIGRKNGVERKWMLYESDDETNKIDLLYESATDEKNGVKVIIPVKWADSNEFYKKIQQQLAYFENVYFDCGTTIKNDFTIVRSEHFQWSEIAMTDRMHICLDNVYYPIDWDKLGISSIGFPVGLRFSLSDGIFPVPNREQLKYTKEAKEIILKKIQIVADHFVAKYNESIKETDDIFTILDYYASSAKHIPHFKEGKGWLDVQHLKHYSKLNFLVPKLRKIQLLNMKRVYEMKDYLLYEYSVKYTLNNSRFASERENSWRNRLDLRNVKDKEIYIFSDISGLKKTYLRDTLDYKRRYFVKKDKIIKLGSVKSRYTGMGINNYIAILQLFNHPKSEWRQRIMEWQYIVSLVTSNFIDVDKMEIPQEWLNDRKKQRVEQMIAKGTNIRRKKLIGEVTGKICSNLERYVSGKNCKLVPIAIQMKEAHKDKKFLIYGGAEHESLFQKLYTVIDKKKVHLVIFSERELKNLKEIELHNWMEIGKFMEGKHKIYRRIVTAYLIHKLKEEYKEVFENTEVLREISTSLGDKVIALYDYEQDHFHNGDGDTYEAMLKVAEEHKLFDSAIYSIYNDVRAVFNKLPFLNTMFYCVNYKTKEEIVAPIRDLFKYYKQRIDWKHYTLPINEEIKVEEVEELTEKPI